MSTTSRSKADQYFDSNKYRRAMQIYQKILDAHPNDFTLHEKLAVCLLEIGDLANSQKECIRVIDLFQNSLIAHLTLAKIYYKQNQIEEAERSARTAIELDPQSPQTYDVLGSILLKQNKLEESEAAYTHSISLDPSFWKPHLNLASIYGIKKQPTDALSESIVAFKHSPSFHTIYGVLVFLENKHQTFFGFLNIALILLLIVLKSIFLVPLAALFVLIVLFRSSVWFRAGYKYRGIFTILTGFFVLSWYFYRLFSGLLIIGD